jgi:hypothetical protein
MNTWIQRVLIGLVATGVFVFFFVPIHPVDSGTMSTKHMSLEPAVPAPGAVVLQNGTIPPNCSTWHELFPAFCGMAHQGGYSDNGDDVVSMCDGIELDGMPYHITWAGPTYYTTCYPPAGDPTEVIFEPYQDPHNPENPVCENWIEVWPEFGLACHVDAWEDNDMSGTLTPCDEVFCNGLLYHIDDIGLDIIIESDPGTPVDETTWGWIKRHLFN